jgi:lysophospholipase L1-like esterase
VNRWFAFALCGVCLAGPGSSRADDLAIDSLDSLLLRLPPEKVAARLVEGQAGQAVRLDFADDCQNVYAQTRSGGTPEWDKADGFSFWVKGDGSDHLGGIELVWNGDYALRYAYAFPIDSTEWRKIVVHWRDLLPETSNAAAVAIDPRQGNAPSKLGPISFGKWWYWRDYAAHSFTIDELRLEPSLPPDDEPARPQGDPLARVRAKLAKGEPISVVLMGDSLTDTRHWANREANWPAMLQTALLASHAVKADIVNMAIGGTELRQNLVLIPRWSVGHANADLVIICFGGNDWSSGMRGPLFEQTCLGAIDRVRRATAGRADVLLCTTCPSVERWETMAELATACRRAAEAKNAGLADVEAAFHEAGKTPAERERLFVSDKTHLSPSGHQTFTSAVIKALEADRR